MTKAASVSFEEVCAAASAARQGEDIEAIKDTLFAKPLSELKRLRAEWAEKHSQLQGRIARVQSRLQLAIDAGLDFEHIARLKKPFVDQLNGDGAGRLGILPTTGGMIDRAIDAIERFTIRQFHEEQHVWCAWPNLPSRFRDTFNAAESLTTELEYLVADNGPVHRLLTALAERKAGSQAVA